MANIAASIRQRLLNLSRAQGRPFQEVLQFYVMERFLYRLSRSTHANRFVLKGALMLQVWASPQARPTMDIDMLGRTDNDMEALVVQLRDIVNVDRSAEDGLIFDGDSLQAETITKDADYDGVRIRGWAELDRARARLQLDIGFGDAPDFAADKQPQWRAFLRRLGQGVPAESEFANVLAVLEQFVGYALEADTAGLPAMHWPPGGPWQKMEQGQ